MRRAAHIFAAAGCTDMTQLNEIPAGASAQMYGVLRAGIDALDLQQSITFQAYTLTILPIDQYVFWQPTTIVCVQGALTYSQQIEQNEDETFGDASVMFTSESEVTNFTDSPVKTLYVASVDGIRFAFMSQRGFFDPAGLYHYFGHSIPPALASQLLDAPGKIDPKQAVVSNSLPLWLALNNYQPKLAGWYSNSTPIYPSFLVTPNLVPPYISVHIGEDDTTADQMAPFITPQGDSYLLCRDRVRLTLYGLQNNAAQDFINCVNQYSLYSCNFGICNLPVIRDAKRTQAELLTIAMKKVVDFEISYNQSRVAVVAQQLIKQAIVTVELSTQLPNP